MSHSSNMLSLCKYTQIAVLSNQDMDLSMYVGSAIELLGSLSQEMSYVTGPERSEIVRTWLVEESFPCLLLVEESKVVGLIATHWNGKPSKDLWIELLAVSPSHRSQGMGNLLMGRLVSWFLQKTVYKTLSLSVNENNTHAIALYERHGLREALNLSLPYRKMTMNRN